MNKTNTKAIAKFDKEFERYAQLWDLVDQKIKKAIPDSFQRFCEIPEITIGYLIKNVSHTSWLQTLVLYAIILVREIENKRLYTTLSYINALFNWATERDYSINRNLDITKLFLDFKSKKRIIAGPLTSYNCLLNYSNIYFTNNLPDIKNELAQYLLPEFNSDQRYLYSILRYEYYLTKMKRKAQVVPIKKELVNLVTLARTRWEWMYALHKKINKIKPLVRSGAIQLPYDIEIENFDKTGVLIFRIWNKNAWVKKHKFQYCINTFRTWTSPKESNSDNIFFQLIGDLPVNSWFLRAIKSDFLQSGPPRSDECIKYAKEMNIPTNCFQNSNCHGILNADPILAGFIARAKKRAKENQNESTILFQAESLISAALIGYLAVIILSMTGMRICEIQQIQLENSIKRIDLPKYNEEDNSWEENGSSSYIFETFTKGKIEVQKTYVPKIIIDSINMYMKFYFDIHGKKLQPIQCLSNFKLFTYCDRFIDQKYTWLFQWGNGFLSNITINHCINFALLEHNVLDENGNLVRISSNVFRHGFAGYLKSKGVPLEKIAPLLHHVNLQVTDYYSQEPDEVIIEELSPILNEIGIELEIDTYAIRTIDDIRQFQQECLKKFGALRKVIGGYCASFCSCEAMHMCASCEYCIPTPDKIHEIDAQIICCEKGAEYLNNCGRPVQAERERIEANRYRLLRSEAEHWDKVLKLEGTSFDELIDSWKFEYEDDPRIQPKILPCLPLEKHDVPASEDKE